LKVERHSLWPAALALTIFMVSGTKDLTTPDLGFDFSYDKLAHLLVFGLLATAVLRIPRFFNSGWQGVCITILLISFYGALDEYRQSFTAGRYVELDDWIADSLGAIIASVVYYKWHCYRRTLEWICFRRKTNIADNA
jgi:VanZ family protein|tara:strand:- start:610 stop:1023 length:414 start_codon:yes stop_codon:yes gene_type:complete